MKKKISCLLALVFMTSIPLSSMAYNVINQSGYKEIWVKDIASGHPWYNPGMGWQQVGLGSSGAPCNPDQKGCSGNVQIVAGINQTYGSSVPATEGVVCTQVNYKQHEGGHTIFIIGGYNSPMQCQFG